MNPFAIETRGLTKVFNGFTAVQGVDLKVLSGSIHALIGPNGAGKTTVFNLLTKFLAPTAGQILVSGQDVTSTDPASIARMGVIRSFQISSVFTHMSLLENVRVALQRHDGEDYAFWRGAWTLDRLNERALDLLDAVGLADVAKLTAAEISYGRKRALELATTLALEPKIMLLDEPMAGLGREDIKNISSLIKRVAKNRTVLMVEHNLSVVAELSDCITVLTHGEVLAEGSYEDISNNEDVQRAYLGATHAH